MKHLYLMPQFWGHVNAPRPKWAKANDRMVEAETAAGITPQNWGKILIFPLWRKVT